MPLAPILRPLLLPLLGIMTRTVRRRQADASIWAENNCRTTVCCMCNREAFDHLITYDGLTHNYTYVSFERHPACAWSSSIQDLSLRLTRSETVSFVSAELKRPKLVGRQGPRAKLSQPLSKSSIPIHASPELFQDAKGQCSTIHRPPSVSFSC